MEITAFVPAKGTSSRVENKNNLELFGEPLYVHSLKILRKCKLVDNIILDTECTEFIDYVKEINLDCEIMLRDKKFADNSTDGNQLLINESNYRKSDLYVQLLCTSPFIKAETIDKGIKVLLENQNFDSVVAVRREKMYLWDEKKPLYDLNNIPNSFTLPDTIIETMGLYIIRHEALVKTRRRIGNNPYLLSISHLESIDINYPDDYRFAKIVERGLRNNDWL